jgi:hypothetical protein
LPYISPGSYIIAPLTSVFVEKRDNTRLQADTFVISEGMEVAKYGLRVGMGLEISTKSDRLEIGGNG